MTNEPRNDPFSEFRKEGEVLKCPFQGEEVPMILRHADVRAAGKNWQQFSSDAPFRVPIPSEEEFRRMRQLPIETDPPEHGEWRKIVEPFFKRAKKVEVIEKVDALIGRFLEEAIARESVEVVNDFALPVQSHALTYLLDVPEKEAETWIGWGMHVFGDKNPEERAGETLERYLEEQFVQARDNPGEDFFSALTKAEFGGRPLTHDEMMGFANLTFAGGRDTVIHTISLIFDHFAKRPEDLIFLREDPKRVALASEEFFRVATPLTHIGRVCPVETEAYGVTVPADGRVSLCWSSANHDETVFEKPEETKLDRKPNPHVAFGAGPHLCLGAPHARLIVRSLLQAMIEKVASVEVVRVERLIEKEARYERANGFGMLEVRAVGR